MYLCFGTYANILKWCVLSGTTNSELVHVLVGTIDPANLYADENNRSAVSRLMNCSGDFPHVHMEPSISATRATTGSLTNVTALAKTTNTAALAEKFDAVIALLDEDRKIKAVGALQELIGSDQTLLDEHRGLFLKCMGAGSTETASAKEIDLPYFLAGLFLYTVLTNDNIRGKESLDALRGYLNETDSRLMEYQVILLDMLSHKDDIQDASVPENCKEYLNNLVVENESIRTLMYKETPRPFYDFYVCNDVDRKVKIPGKNNAYQTETIHDATISKIAGVSQFTILSGTGGLGKSMMMRHLLLE